MVSTAPRNKTPVTNGAPERKSRHEITMKTTRTKRKTKSRKQENQAAKKTTKKQELHQ